MGLSALTTFIGGGIIGAMAGVALSVLASQKMTEAKRRKTAFALMIFNTVVTIAVASISTV